MIQQIRQSKKTTNCEQEAKTSSSIDHPEIINNMDQDSKTQRKTIPQIPRKRPQLHMQKRNRSCRKDMDHHCHDSPSPQKTSQNLTPLNEHDSECKHIFD